MGKIVERTIPRRKLTSPSLNRSDQAHVADDRRYLALDAPVSLLGAGSDWFSIEREGARLRVTPKLAIPRRCVLKGVARFHHSRGFPDVNVVMGKLLFKPGATESQVFEPYTLDPGRTFSELMFLVEVTPDDELFSSKARWRNNEATAHRLLATAQVPWSGLSDQDVTELNQGEPWLLPLEGCVLHALAGWSQGQGDTVIEVGSFRGLSLAMLARGLRREGASSSLVSIDPHYDRENLAYVRLALEAIGEGDRLVQITRGSDEAVSHFRPGVASLVFIDGDHSYDQVVRDFENYAPLIASGGCLAFHDYGYGSHNGKPDVVPDVRRAIDDHVMASEDFEPLLLAHTLIAFRKR